MRKLLIMMVLFALATGAVPYTAAQDDDCMAGDFDLCDRAESHEDWVRSLAEVYAEDGFETWLAEAGYEYDSVSRAARQPEELTFESEDGDDSDIVVAGMQVRATNLSFSWPAGMTIDREVEVGKCYQPDQENPSKVCTDVVGFTGTATLWVSVIDWGQLDPEGDNSDPSNGCLTLQDLGELGEIITELENNGDLSGAQITFDSDWVAPPGWTIQRSGNTTEFIREGQTGSVWSPEDCRPLNRR